MQANQDPDEPATKKTEIVFGILFILTTPLYLIIQPHKDPNGPEFVLFLIVDPAILLGFTNIIGALMLADGLYFFWKRRKGN